MRKLLTILILLPSLLFGQTTNFTFSAIPFSDGDIKSPFRGPERWHDMGTGYKFAYTFADGTSEPLDYYVRTGLSWNFLETSQGVYDFSRVGSAINAAISRGQKFSFNIMAVYPGNPNGISADGGTLTYPLYLHQNMQAAGGNNTDYLSGSTWVPNYNSSFFLSRVEALLQALAQYIQQGSYNGVAYWKAIGYIDIGIVGCFGEWHHGGIYGSGTPYPSGPPTGRLGTAASLIRIIDAHKNAFPNFPLVAIQHAFDANSLDNTKVPPEVGYYALTASNNYGVFGWKRMNIGRGWESYIPNTTINHPYVYTVPNGGGLFRFDTAISNRWRRAIMCGEGPNYDTKGSGAFPFYNLPNEVRQYHISMFANGNFSENCGQAPVCAPQGTRDSLFYAWKLMGYRNYLTGGNMPTTLQNGVPFTINLNWRNDGVAPVYENWKVQYELRQGSTVVWTGTSAYNMRTLLPGTGTSSDQLSFAGVTAGTYSLVIIIRDPNGYRQPFPLGQYGRQSDGSYVLRSSVSVINGSGTVVNAGGNVTLPVGTTATGLSGTVTGGFVNTWAWTQVSGPNSATITAGAAYTATVSNLVGGTYTFRLQVNGAEFDDVIVTIQAATEPRKGFSIYLPIKAAHP